MFTLRKKTRDAVRRRRAAGPADADPDRAPRISSTGNRSRGPYPDGFEKAMFGMGCFWGAERKFWELGDGIHVTAVGYAAGHTPNPTYEEVCSGAPATTRSCSSSTIRRRSATRSC